MYNINILHYEYIIYIIQYKTSLFSGLEKLKAAERQT